ncbi:MAG: hypothetical protein MHMPM18_005011, partial [Marteilia pararefringens]
MAPAKNQKYVKSTEKRNNKRLKAVFGDKFDQPSFNPDEYIKKANMNRPRSERNSNMSQKSSEKT